MVDNLPLPNLLVDYLPLPLVYLELESVQAGRVQRRMFLDGLQARSRRRCDWEHTVVAPGELLLRHSVEGWHVDLDQLGAEDAEI